MFNSTCIIYLSLIFLHFIHYQAYQYMYMHVIRIFMLNGFENKINGRNLQISYKIYFLNFSPLLVIWMETDL